MKLILFAFLSLIVVTASQDERNSSNPNELRAAPNVKPGVCTPPSSGWNLGPHPLKKDKSKPESLKSPESLYYNYPGFFPDYFFFYAYQQPMPRFFPPQQPSRCNPECRSDSDCIGTLKCCGSICNARCSPPLQYDENCGLIPTDAYCKEVCDRKKTCLTTVAPNCRDYSRYCVSFCRNNNSCYGRKCCRNLRCSFTCI